MREVRLPAKINSKDKSFIIKSTFYHHNLPGSWSVYVQKFFRDDLTYLLYFYRPWGKKMSRYLSKIFLHIKSVGTVI